MVNVCSGGWRWLHEYANELLEPIESRRENEWEKEENVIDYQLFVNEGLSVCYWKYCWQVLNIWKAKRGVKRVESLNSAPAGGQVQDALDVTLWSTSVFEVNDGHVDAQWETGRIERLWLPSMTMISGHCWCSGVACLQRVRRCNFTWPAGFFFGTWNRTARSVGRDIEGRTRAVVASRYFIDLNELLDDSME